MEELEQVVKEHVPKEATVLMAGDEHARVQLDGRDVLPFPSNSGESGGRGEDLIEQLERMREAGARYIVFPKSQLPGLEDLLAFQEHLEGRYRTVFRDGGYCAIYVLE